MSAHSSQSESDEYSSRSEHSHQSKHGSQNKQNESKYQETSPKSRAGDQFGDGPSIPSPRAHVPEGEAAGREYVQQCGGRWPQGYPMPQGVEQLPPPELALTGSGIVRGQPASSPTPKDFLAGLSDVSCSTGNPRWRPLKRKRQ